MSLPEWARHSLRRMDGISGREPERDGRDAGEHAGRRETGDDNLRGDSCI